MRGVPVHLALDEQLDELAAGIVERIDLVPPELGALLRPPKLRVARATAPRVQSYTLVSGGVPTILLGGASYSAILAYCRAAATFFLPDHHGGPRPSARWAAARLAMASALDWFASPAEEPRVPRIPTTPRQERVARAFAAYTYRFVLCHEMAHVALGHLDRANLDRPPDGDDVAVLRASQQQELEADSFGLELQVRSVPDRSQLVMALSAGMYFIYFNRLFDDVRLMLLAGLVDHEAWEIELSHPPFLQRVLNLMSAAQGLEGEVAARGLEMLHGDLSKLVGDLWTAADQEQEVVAAETGRLLARVTDDSHRDTPPLVQLFNRSPLGVLRALEPFRPGDDSDLPAGMSAPPLVEQLLAKLPTEFAEFHRRTKTERSRQLA
jgi:hypothetical protein